MSKTKRRRQALARAAFILEPDDPRLSAWRVAHFARGMKWWVGQKQRQIDELNRQRGVA